jgi:hypothetical protein
MTSDEREKLHKIEFPDPFYFLYILSNSSMKADYFVDTSERAEDVRF